MRLRDRVAPILAALGNTGSSSSTISNVDDSGDKLSLRSSREALASARKNSLRPHNRDVD